ncbi:MAG: beta-N-acetylhexosaminidase [Anaerolineae bacterium]
MANQELVIIPEPKQIIWGEGAFVLDAQTVIVLLPSSGESDHFAARLLQQEITQATGLQLPLIKLAHPLVGCKLIVLASDCQALNAFLGEKFAVKDLSHHGEQAYGIEIGEERVVACGNSVEGLFFAVQTLRQVARVQTVNWQQMSITDWPSLASRGLMLDVSRGKVPTIETIMLLIDQLCLYKMNVLQFYTEHTFVFPHHPRIGQDCGSLSSDDILEIDAYARPRHVQLMPNLNSFGHCEHLLNLPEYAPLAESAAHWSFCPIDERTFELVDDLYADLIPSFSCKVLNIGCDETFDLGKGRSKEQVLAKGIGRVYLEYILRLRTLAAKYGCKIQLWGDILLHHPELVSELPEDVTLLDWHYEAADDYPSLSIFEASGRPFWVCPGTSSWNTLFPRLLNSNGNIRTLARLGVAHGATGFLNTDWGDGGHYQPIGQCWYGYIYGAEQSWSGGQTDDAVFNTRFGRLFFGPDGMLVVDAISELGRLNTLPGMALPNANSSIFALLDEPLVGPTADQLPDNTLDEISAATHRIENTLRMASSTTTDPASVQELVYTTRLLAYMARKVTLSKQIRQSLAQLACEPDKALHILDQADKTLASLATGLTELEIVFRSQWLLRARYSEIKITLTHFNKLRARFATARAWLSEQMVSIRGGAKPDGSLAEYAKEAASYEILYQGWIRHLHEIGIIWD